MSAPSECACCGDPIVGERSWSSLVGADLPYCAACVGDDDEVAATADPYIAWWHAARTDGAATLSLDEFVEGCLDNVDDVAADPDVCASFLDAVGAAIRRGCA